MATLLEWDAHIPEFLEVHREALKAAQYLPHESALVAARPQRRRRRADPREPGLEHRLGELRALGEEAVTRVDSVSFRLPCGADVLGRVKVGGDLDDRVGGLGMERSAVVGREDRNRLDALGPAGTEDAPRDLPPVRDEQPAHRVSLGRPGPTSGPI